MNITKIAINKSLNKLLHRGRMLVSVGDRWEFYLFHDVSDVDQFFFTNDAKVNDAVFAKYGIKKVINNEYPTLLDGNGLFELSNTTSTVKTPTDDIYLAISWGPGGAECWRLRIYNTLFFTFVYYEHEWVA